MEYTIVDGQNKKDQKYYITGKLSNGKITLKGSSKDKRKAFKIFIRLIHIHRRFDKDVSFKIIYEIGSGVITLKHNRRGMRNFLYIKLNEGS